MSESLIMKQIQIAWSKTGNRLFRNNVGTGWVGQAIVCSKESTIKVHKGTVVIYNPRPLHSGLCVGSSDLIGFKRVTITQEMVGQTIAQFAAVETKDTRGRLTVEQSNFIKAVNDAGGFAVMAKTVADATPSDLKS